MASDHIEIRIDQYRNIKAESRDAVGNLSDLLVAVQARVADPA
jgi:hypothetical protein